MAEGTGTAQRMRIIICWIVVCSTLCWKETEANIPPKFVVEGGGGGEMIVKLKEGATQTPVGSVVYAVQASDADGDRLTFALQGAVANQLLSVQSVAHDRAHLILNKELDREVFNVTFF